jgi:hypothetical protein
MPNEAVVGILAAVAIAAASVWAVEHMAEQRSRRDRQLDAIDQTVRQMVAILGDAGAVLAGEGATKPGRFDADAFPKADARLVGDIAALRTYYGVLRDLHRRAPGSGFRESDGQSVANASVQVRSALSAQERRVLEHQPIRTLTGEEALELAALLQGVTSAIRDSAMADDALQGRG